MENVEYKLINKETGQRLSAPLKFIGEQEVAGKKFTGIEGGFGEGKKTMLVKDIAAIHGKDVGYLNRNINNNIARFKTGIDIIDLKRANAFGALGYESLGYTKQTFNQSKNIYLLSERGYAKLLKIMDDDKSWEVYDLLVDDYFNMREQAKLSFEDIMIATLQEMKGVKNEVSNLKIAQEQHEVKINSVLDHVTLNTKKVQNLANLLKAKLNTLYGFKISASDAVYKDARKKLFKKYRVRRWEEIPVSEYDAVFADIDELNDVKDINF